MKPFGAKIISKFIKNPQKRELIYRILSDGGFAEAIIEQKNRIKKLLFYSHNYLTKPNVVVVWLVGGLGNQMYLYAFGKMLQMRGYNVIFDAGTYRYKDIYGAQNGGGGI